MNRRSILEIHRGRHEGVIPLSLWQSNQQERIGRGNTPRGGGRVIREYLLTGVAYCWECYNWDGRQAPMHGISVRTDLFYRCSTVQGEYKMCNKPKPCVFTDTLASLDMDAAEHLSKRVLLGRHRSTLHQQVLETQVTQLVERLVIPEEWYEIILAYYLSDKGISEFELMSYNLRQELTRQRELFKRGHITSAEYEQAYLHNNRQLQFLQPSAQPESREILPLLHNFPELWRKMKINERRTILQAMFTGLYFDSSRQLRKVSAKSPFDQLLGVETSAQNIAVAMEHEIAA